MTKITWENLDLLHKLPEFVRNHVVAKLGREQKNGSYINETIPIEELDKADVVTSKSSIKDFHRPVLDIDFPIAIIESSTKGHYHLYMDKKLSWFEYEKLLRVLEEVGIIEEGYLYASLDREFTSVRLPWVGKF
jgi:hypothetical protein